MANVHTEQVKLSVADGTEMTEENWNQDYAKSLGVFLNGKGIHSMGPKGEVIVDDNFYIIFNAHHDGLPFKLPPQKRFSRYSHSII